MSGTEADSITIDGHHIQPPGGLKKQEKDTVQVSLKERQSSPPIAEDTKCTPVFLRRVPLPFFSDMGTPALFPGTSFTPAGFPP